MKYFAIFFTISIQCCYIQVSSVIIECPHAQGVPLNDVTENLRKKTFLAIKYMRNINYQLPVSYPSTENNGISLIKYEFLNKIMFTEATTIINVRGDRPMGFKVTWYFEFILHDERAIFKSKHKFTEKAIDLESNKVLRDRVYNWRDVLTFALVQVGANDSYRIYKDCSGQYGWAEISYSTLQNFIQQGNDPLTAYAQEINEALLQLGIPNGEIFSAPDILLAYVLDPGLFSSV